MIDSTTSRCAARTGRRWSSPDSSEMPPASPSLSGNAHHPPGTHRAFAISWINHLMMGDSCHASPRAGRNNRGLKLFSTDMRPSRNKFLAALTTVVFAAIVLLVPASQANATWTVKGGGFGHGVGMSAYGAYGMAKHGWSHKKILRHYYSHTRIRDVKRSHDVKVLLKTDSGNVYF